MGKSRLRSERIGRIKRCRNLVFLPHDLVIEILYLLPVKSLVRFQCVCKSWRDLIKTKSFALDHYRRSSSRNGGMVWAYHKNSPSVPKCDFYVMDNPTHDSFLLDPVRHAVAKVKPNMPLLCRSLTSCYECCGLLCIHNMYIDRYSVCNPIINELEVLPNPPRDILHTFGMGFGLVPSTDDFMVVRISAVSRACCTKLPFTVDVYDQGSETWRRSIKSDLPPLNRILTLSKGEYLNGTYQWLVRYVAQHKGAPVRSCLLSFDMKDEVLYWTSLPKVPNRSCDWFILKQKESLAYLYRPNDTWKESCYIWSRIGDRFNGSWIRQYAFHICHFSYPVLSWKNLVLLNDGHGEVFTFVDLGSDGVEKVIHLDRPSSFVYFFFN